MQGLRNVEILEIEALELFSSIRVLDSLYFGGGTMLRLCHNLNRYSTGLDFWIDSIEDSQAIFSKINIGLINKYNLIDAKNKNLLMTFEIKSQKESRSLKIEIRKEQKDFDWEKKIAYSKYSSKQVVVRGLTLQQMMKNKIEAILERKIIGDCFDIEFLLMRGIDLPDDKNKLKSLVTIIDHFKTQDYKALSSTLEIEERKYYIENNFELLKEEIRKIIIL